VHEKPSVNWQHHHKLYVDNMLILQGLSRNISRREKTEKIITPDFKSGVPSAEGGRWVRFPCTSANDLLNLEVIIFGLLFLLVSRFE
jgi:hypothetical protein